MKSSLAVKERPVPAPAAELAVVVACNNLVCTIPARHVERLFLREEIELRPAAYRRGSGGRLPQVVHAAGEPFAAWNLGTLLELAPVSTAWVLMRLPAEGGAVPIALRTGACLVVQPTPPAAALPPGLFRERGEGIVGAFATSGLRGKRPDAPLGLCLDPLRLWTAAELASARQAVALDEERAQP